MGCSERIDTILNRTELYVGLLKRLIILGLVRLQLLHWQHFAGRRTMNIPEKKKQNKISLYPRLPSVSSNHIITPILRQFHWFPIQKRICHKILSATYRSVHDNTPSTSLISSQNTTLLAFSDQHLDLSLMFQGPGIPRQSGTASEPSDMSLPPSGMSSPRASKRSTPFSLSDLR